MLAVTREPRTSRGAVPSTHRIGRYDANGRADSSERSRRRCWRQLVNAWGIEISKAARIRALNKQLDTAFQLRDWYLVGILQDEIAALTPNSTSASSDT